MDIKKICEILKTKYTYMSEAEVREMLDEELEKEPGDMDIELIELCLDALDGGEKCSKGKHTGEYKFGRKRFRKKAVMTVAAVLAILICISGTALAKKLHMDVSDEGSVQYKGDHFEIELNDKTDEEDTIKADELIEALNEEGFNEVMLPQGLLEDEYRKYGFVVSQDEEENCYAVLNFENKAKEISGTMSIIKYGKEYDFNSGQSDLKATYNEVLQQTIAGIDVLVASSAKKASIYYMNGDTEYLIFLSGCDFETAKEISESIG